MAEIITMPRLSDTMTEGVVAEWLKKVGDKVEEGDILAQIETDKATMEFESFNEGYLLHIGLQEGETAPVDSLLAIIGEKGEDISALLTGSATTAPAVTEETPAAPVAEEVTNSTEKKPEEEAFVVPDNITVVTMPRLSDTMTDGTVASWLKKVGDSVSEGDILAEIETDKATMEFESFNEGTLLYIGLEEGGNAPVDSLLAIIGEAGTDVTAVVEGFKVVSAPNTEAPKATTAEEKKSVAPAPIETKQSTTTTATKKVSAVNSENGRIKASPLAKALAEEKGINLAKVIGTGEGGRIVKVDIENYNPVVEVDSNPSTTAVAAPAGEVSQTEVKNSQMRKAIVKALDHSQNTAVNFTVTMDIDMDNAIASRKLINSIPDTKVSFNDLVVKATAMALKSHPQVNTEWTNEQTIYNNHISVGVAVAIEDGLVVPVIPFTDTKSLTQIGAEVKDLAIKAKNKKLTPDEMSGSTFTVSNLGMFGVDHFTSIINQPNSAILSVGGIKQKPVVKNGEIVVGNVMTLTLACDHRTIDGAVGAAFMNTLKQYIENPVTMIA
ncbi:pyruvate dehydrogenase E2 component (dihydrolipoamide acetyltransferase) [Lutibacter oricola]|uniref:Dihydrolipoamide acetyltransferase component of pyruvate dehydrogenase complex n=1 Tax=Lutibacter oricola TaxID=762486 RepID=A0A1H3GDU9_9FLAO|nr:pyruvate dehydrogenase complex dihydrolipoamide acetyltransferase [Lutibacter oricola]SDY01451.1 pyruvate dehydrogenase E2 component (dihydrolipoamide acetyltransferase) [Lutibacter oricola]